MLKFIHQVGIAARAFAILGALAACAQEPSDATFGAAQKPSQEAVLLDAKVDAALATLAQEIPATQVLAKDAKGVLVFPTIIKAGLIVGGQIGEGALRVNGETKNYYVSTGLSYGLQVGAQKFGYAMYFMSDEDMKYLDNSAGWEVGTAPSLVIADAGLAKTLSTTSAQKGIYVFFFSQKGLMAGIGLQGTKVTSFNPS